MKPIKSFVEKPSSFCIDFSTNEDDSFYVSKKDGGCYQKIDNETTHLPGANAKGFYVIPFRKPGVETEHKYSVVLDFSLQGIEDSLIVGLTNLGVPAKHWCDQVNKILGENK